MAEMLHPALTPLSEALGELQHHNIARQLSTPESANECLVKFGTALMEMEARFDILDSFFAKRLAELGAVLIKKAGIIPHLVDKHQNKSPIPNILAQAGASILDNELKNHPQRNQYQFQKKIRARGLRFVKRTKSAKAATPILETLEKHNLALTSRDLPKWKEQPVLPSFETTQLRILRTQLNKTQQHWKEQGLLDTQYDWI